MTVVLKLGGELMLPDRAKDLQHIAHSVASFAERGEGVVVVHGGGPQTNALMSQTGQTPKMVEGRRVTDEAALWTMIRAVRGEVNVRLVGTLSTAGIRAVGLDGLAGNCIRCVREAPREIKTAPGAYVDYGYVGEITHVDADFVRMFLNGSMVPVMACLGTDERGHPYNVNADTVAGAVAAALSADHLVFLTGTDGVLADRHDPSTRHPHLTRVEALAGIEDGSIADGMVPKMREAIHALESGVSAVHVLGPPESGGLERALSHPGLTGTALTL